MNTEFDAFPEPPSAQADDLRRSTGPFLRAVSLALTVKPCLARTECADGGLTGRGFIRAIRGLCALIGERAEAAFRENMLSVLWDMRVGHETQQAAELQSDADSRVMFRCAAPFAGAADAEYYNFDAGYEQVTTYRIVAEVLGATPAADFCSYIASAVPDALRPRVAFKLLTVLQAACVSIEVLGPGRLRLQLTAADETMLIE